VCSGSGAAPFGGSCLVATSATDSASGLPVAGEGVSPAQQRFLGEEGAQFTARTHQTRREHDGGVFSTPTSTNVCRLRSCRASGSAIIVSDASPNAGRGHRFALCRNNFGSLLAHCLGLPSHRALHAVG
jgi:hypothetical protein